MIQQFSFKKHPILDVLERIDILFPGIRKAIAIFFDPDENRIVSFEKRKDNDQLSFIEPDSLLTDISKERTRNIPYSWVDDIEDQETGSSKPFQMELEDEYQKNVLLIRLTGNHDNGKDLIYFYLDEGISIFQFSVDKTPLSTREKNLTGQLVYNSLQLILSQHRQNSSLFHLFNASFQNTIENLKSNESELKSTRQNYMQSIISFCNYHLQRISDASAFTFQLSEKAIEKIGTYKDKFELLENIITNAASVAVNRSFDKEGSIVVIDSSDIIFYSYEPEKTELHIAETDRYSKTRDILDRYEFAAEKVLENNLPLNGKNVGNYCSNGISPSAITDSINKHKQKMLTLFEMNPTKWPIIRNRFRPVAKLLSEHKGNRMKIAN